MIFAQWTGSQTFLLGLLILATGMMLRRSLRLSRRSRDRDVLAEAREALRRAETSESARILSLEVHLQELARELEGRIETRTSVLQCLLDDAQDRIAELRRLIDKSPRLTNGSLLSHAPDIVVSSHRPSHSRTSEETGSHRSGKAEKSSGDCLRVFITSLAEAGFRPEEIACCANVSTQFVQAILDEESGDHRSAAA